MDENHHFIIAQCALAAIEELAEKEKDIIFTKEEKEKIKQIKLEKENGSKRKRWLYPGKRVR